MPDSAIGGLAGAGGGFALGGPVGAGIGGMLGSGIGAGFDTMATNAQQIQLARDQMDFQKYMSGSAYQRGVADLKAAGLNPLLAAMNGGASTPGGAMAQITSPGGPAAQGFANAGQALIQSKMNDSNISLNESNAALLDQKTETESYNAESAAANAETAKMQNQIMKAGMDSEMKMAPYRPYIDAAGKVIGAGTNALEGFGIFKGLKYLGQGKATPGTGLTKDGTKFNLDTGEILPYGQKQGVPVGNQPQ